jgi:hypothetical protein
VPALPLRPWINGFAFVTRLEYALSRDEEDPDVFGESRGGLEGVGVRDMADLLEARGEGGTLGSRGERERRSGDEERGEETAGV